jgi:hypothetical protein
MDNKINNIIKKLNDALFTITSEGASSFFKLYKLIDEIEMMELIDEKIPYNYIINELYDIIISLPIECSKSAYNLNIIKDEISNLQKEVLK